VVTRQIFANPEALAFVFTNERCTHRFDPDACEDSVIKDLKTVKRRGYHLSKVLIVDDTPRTFRRNWGNAIRMRSWRGSPEDDELQRLLPFLESLGPVDDVRPIDKRGWRSYGTRTGDFSDELL
jgi:hypothetical protein